MIDLCVALADPRSRVTFALWLAVISLALPYWLGLRGLAVVLAGLAVTVVVLNIILGQC